MRIEKSKTNKQKKDRKKMRTSAVDSEVSTAGNTRRIRTFDPFVKVQIKFLPVSQVRPRVRNNCLKWFCPGGNRRDKSIKLHKAAKSYFDVPGRRSYHTGQHHFKRQLSTVGLVEGHCEVSGGMVIGKSNSYTNHGLAK